MKNKTIVGYLVKKYLKFDKTQPFITITALLAFLGVSIGVMVLIVTMAIMNGTLKEFEDKLFTMNYPLTVYPKFVEYVDKDIENLISKELPHLKLSPFIRTQAIVKNGSNMSGGILFGVNFQKEKEINEIVKKSLPKENVSGFKIILGKGIVEDIGAISGQKLMMIFTTTEPTGFSNTPRMKRFEYINEFNSGLIAYDKAYMYTDIIALQKILRIKLHRYDGIHIYSENPKDDIIKLQKILPYTVGVLGWWQQNGNFFSALAMEKKALFIVLMLIILVASLNIISSLLMTVMSRRKEIALLLSLGASKKEVRDSFYYLGLIIGGSGVIVGILLGFGFMYILSSFDIITLPVDVYGTSKLPLELSISDLIFTIVGSLIVIMLSAFYPAKKASNIDVINILRYE